MNEVGKRPSVVFFSFLTKSECIARSRNEIKYKDKDGSSANGRILYCGVTFGRTVST